ncbi:hypothetical protein G8O24_02075 [Bradyrhizobium sp. INPA01-394B]|uniref:Glycosyltransferase RgtA/B/C/D-like domain-containing protein n=1 Tax=Bradyrhizobium campsiandrae TaxID=1729892 RepID=A0ABR7UDK5_9BRAD|nr:hypothetical protein [Bradyrhizobium campsiandrae]MBC9876131.1 hypothetical protein [Bradyrhizobium campsiandrae]MBC9982045.1 hypothetical protein [Bradyrhizobium campsiandrae]
MNDRTFWTSQTIAGQSGATSSSTLGTYAFLISLLSVFYVSNASLILSHYDLGWHLAAGELIRSKSHVPFQDPWSFTLGTKQWFNLSWLWDVIASVIVEYAGYGGLVGLVVICGALIVLYLTSACLASGASTLAVGAAIFATCLLYPAYEAAPNSYLAASPNVATMLLSVIFYRECLRSTKLLLLPLLMMLWVNLHGGFVLGFMILAVFGAGALVRRDWSRFKIIALAGLGCFAATFVNPWGWQVYQGVTATLGHFVQGNIGEWLPYAHNMEIPGSIPGMAYILAFVALELRYGASTKIRLEPRILSWVFLALGLTQFRYMSFFFIFSAIPVALHLDRFLPRQLPHLAVQQAFMTAAIAGACALPLTFFRIEPAIALPDMLSEQDAQYLQTHLTHARILNHWNVGGYLILRTHGSVPLFVDGRAATAYPDELLRDYFRLVHWEIDEGAWDEILEKYRIDAVLWLTNHEELRQFLVGKRGWKEDHTGAYESVYVRPGLAH